MQETGLVKYDAMCLAIAQCHKVDEVAELRHKARAFEVYAKQAKNLEAERLAIKVRIRAERRAGELLKEMKKTGQRHTHGGDQKSKSRPTTSKLTDLGVSKDQASMWQKLAEVPTEEFEEALASPAKPNTERIILAAAAKEEAKKPPVPKIRVDPDASWAYHRIADFAEIIKRPASELFPLMLDYQQENLREFIPYFVKWLQEMK